MKTRLRALLAAGLLALAAGCIGVPGEQEPCPWPPENVAAPGSGGAAALARTLGACG